MLTADFLNHFGPKFRVKEAAKFLDVHPQLLYIWGEIVPEKWAYMIYVKTDKAVALRASDYE